MGKSITADIFGIATLFVMVAFAAMLIHNSSGTTAVIKSVGDTFTNLLKTVTLQ